jgi:hypothetical protein
MRRPHIANLLGSSKNAFSDYRDLEIHDLRVDTAAHWLDRVKTPCGEINASKVANI